VEALAVFRSTAEGSLDVVAVSRLDFAAAARLADQHATGIRTGDALQKPMICRQQTAARGHCRRANPGVVAIESIKKHKAAYLVPQAIRSAKVLAFEELGMEAIYEFEVVNMPITVWWIAPGSRCIKSRQMTH